VATHAHAVRTVPAAPARAESRPGEAAAPWSGNVLGTWEIVRLSWLIAQSIDGTALAPERERGRRFQRVLAEAFALRAELKELAMPDTIICRCEDVRLGELAGFLSWREAKLHTRCGMGACQGRVCGAALEFVAGMPAASVRPPLVPVSVAVLAGKE